MHFFSGSCRFVFTDSCLLEESNLTDYVFLRRSGIIVAGSMLTNMNCCKCFQNFILALEYHGIFKALLLTFIELNSVALLVGSLWPFYFVA